MLSEAGKCPKTEATVLRSELGWTPRPTEHSICPTSLPHPFTISLGDVSSLHGYGKGCNTEGPDQPFANIHYHTEELTGEMLVFARLCSEPRSKPWLHLTWKCSEVQQCNFHTRRWQWT